jgi:hypothetical protein
MRLAEIALLALVLYCLVAAGMYLLQRKLQYFPGAQARTPESVGLTGVEPVKITTPDGETLLAWHAPAPAGQPTLLYLHGNGGGISDRPLKYAAFKQAGFGVLALSYRGYEGSTGSPSEQGLVSDATAAYDWLAGRGADRILLLGESLGSGVAVQLAAKRKVKALVLEAPFASAVDIGAKAYWFLPVRLLMKDQYRSIDYIAHVKAPLLVLHGKRDGIVPFEQGRRLFEAANQPKQFVSLDKMGHELIGEASLWQREIEFFRQQ